VNATLLAPTPRAAATRDASNPRRTDREARINERGCIYTRRVDEAAWALAGAAVGAAVAVTSWHTVRSRRSPRPEAPLRLEHADVDAQEAGTEARVQTLVLSSLPDGVVLFDPDGATAFASDAVRGLIGGPPRTRAELVPLGIREAADHAASGAAVDLVVETGTPTRWLRATATPAGRDGGVLLVIRDVTESRRLDAIRRDFVTNASHELKTPAASIQAIAETILKAAADDPGAVTRFAGQLEGEAARLSRIVADLLDLSRLESGSDAAEPFHLDALVREEAQRFADIASDAGLTLSIETPGPAPVTGSAKDFSLLVRNLVDNAIRYSPRGSVRIRTEADGVTVTLSVADDGVGIPTKDLPRIFERFYRVDRARSRESGGTGLGLAIVKHVAENHGGSVSVRSELGRGSEFTVRLPQA